MRGIAIDDDYRGSEEVDGVFAPVHLATAAVPFIQTAAIAMELRPRCESPIEVMLGAALIAAARDRYNIVPQFRLGAYRYDFAVMGQNAVPLVLVECDGAAFHSTPAQLANDKAKDAAALMISTRVIRVTGSEINRNPAAWAAFILGECRRGARSE